MIVPGTAEDERLMASTAHEDRDGNEAAVTDPVPPCAAEAGLAEDGRGPEPLHPSGSDAYENWTRRDLFSECGALGINMPPSATKEHMVKVLHAWNHIHRAHDVEPTEKPQ
jgi:hypothetical protein